MSKLKFKEKGHKYYTDDDFQWVSATSLVSQFKQPFDQQKVAESCSKGKNPKYKGKSPEEIISIWNKESKRATDLGSWYHDQREKDVLNCNTITRDGIELPIVNTIYKEGIKEAPDQKVKPGIYPEHMVYLRSASVCGQVDRAEVFEDRIDIYDYKTNKEVKKRSYQYWDGSRKMMLGPLRHLEDCEVNHYALQLSIYMFIMLKHNYKLSPGIMEIDHIEFEVEEEDENGFPIHALNPLGEPIIKKVNPIQLPYLKKEVIAMFKWLKKHKQIVLYND